MSHSCCLADLFYVTVLHIDTSFDLVLIIRSSSLPKEILNTLVHFCKRKFVPKTLLLTLKLDGCFFLTTGILKQIYCTLQRFKDWVFAVFRKNIMLKIRTINVKHLVINWRINNMDKLVFQSTVHTADRVFVNLCCSSGSEVLCLVH